MTEKSQPIRFSRAQIATLSACLRRFQLRYVDRVAWPVPPLPDSVRQAQARGQAFHQLVQRHFLKLTSAEIPDELLAWWRAFEAYGPQMLADGRLFTELTLTTPIGRHLLTGRFDLLVLTPEEAHIYDWKTEPHPRSAVQLAQDLQSRIYLTLLAQGQSALQLKTPPYPPEKIALTYWYAADPAQSVTVRYTTAEAARNWQELAEVVALLESQRDLAPEVVWPLTSDWSQCTHCVYQTYCGRGTVTPQQIHERLASYDVAFAEDGDLLDVSFDWHNFDDDDDDFGVDAATLLPPMPAS